jgi:hypothetical protein
MAPEPMKLDVQWPLDMRVVVAAGIGHGTVIGYSGQTVTVQLDGDPEGPSNWHPTWLEPVDG